MIDIKIIASGSKGNAYIIADGEKKIIIDPGIRFKDLIRKVDFSITDIDFCLISHEHKDHCIAAKKLSKLGVQLVMSRGTMDRLKLPGLIAISERPITDVHGWDILPFQTQHDAQEPLGFLICTPSRKKILYATDTYYIRYNFRDVNYYMVEANYREEILLANEDLHPIHKDRVRQSHFEIENLKRFFSAQDLSKCEKILLIHLSDDNSDENYFKTSIEAVTGKPVYLK